MALAFDDSRPQQSEAASNSQEHEYDPGREKVRHSSPATACAVCGGYGSLKRHQGIRCYGFTVGSICYCTRIDAGGRPQNGGNSWPHNLQGPCDCGEIHDQRPEVQARARRAAAKSPKPFITPPDEIDGCQLTAWYWYFDEDRTPREWIFRYEHANPDGTADKTFRQARINADGKGEWKLGDDFQRVLYRLPELLAADPAQPVYITEGEKDADRLASLDLVATSSPEGAGKFSQVRDAAVWLRDRAVIIIEDNDLPGSRHTAQIIASLQGIARSLSVIRFPDRRAGYDVSDWLDAGGDIAALPGLAQFWQPETQAAPPDNQVDCQVYEIPTDVAELQAEVRRLQALLAARDAEIARLNADLKTRGEACQRMNAAKQWDQKVAAMPSKHISASNRCNLIAVRQLVERKPKDENGFTQVYTAELGDESGTSSSTSQKALSWLKNAGYIETKKFTVYTETGAEPRIAVKLAEKGERPWDYVPQELRNHGGAGRGAGRKCKHCNSSDVTVLETKVQTLQRKVSSVRCNQCGVVDLQRDGDDRLISEEIVEADNQVDYAEAPSEEQDEANNQLDCQQEQEPDGEPVQADKQDTSIPLILIQRQVDCQPGVTPVNPNLPGNTSGKRIERYQKAGMAYREACDLVKAENRAWLTSLEALERREALS